MREIILKEDEQKVVAYLAEKTESDALGFFSQEQEKPKICPQLNIDVDTFPSIIRNLTEMGFLKPVSDDRMHFEINFERCIQAARKIQVQKAEAAAPKDQVDLITDSFRKHPVIAWIIVGVLGLTVALTLINECVELWKNFAGR